MMESEGAVAMARLAAKRQLGSLRAQINSHGTAGNTNSEESYLRLQQESSKARFVMRHLSTCLEASGSDPRECDLVTSLQALLTEAVVQRSVLYESVFGQQKKDSLKAFKQSIVALIERGEAPQWIATVTKDDLINHGQEVNRLYQILVEAHGDSHGVPLVDSWTLARAAKRIDLFTSKQCESLYKRSIEVDRVMLMQTARLAQSLQDEQELKRILSLSSCKLQDKDKLKPSLPGWTCNQCTYLNKADEEKCRACHSSRAQESFVTIAKRKPSKSLENDKLLEAKANAKSVVLKSTPTRSPFTVWVHNKHIPEMIGAKGTSQRKLLKLSGATTLYAYQDRLDKNQMCPVVVHGSVESFQKVVAFLEKKFNSKSVQTMAASETVWIRNVDVPDMIGPGGATVKRMCRETGVQSITAWQEHVDEQGMCPVDIRGRREDVKKAATLIMNMFCGVNGKTLSAIIAASKKEPDLPSATLEVTVQAMTVSALKGISAPKKATESKAEEIAQTMPESPIALKDAPAPNGTTESKADDTMAARQLGDRTHLEPARALEPQTLQERSFLFPCSDSDTVPSQDFVSQGGDTAAVVSQMMEEEVTTKPQSAPRHEGDPMTATLNAALNVSGEDETLASFFDAQDHEPTTEEKPSAMLRFLQDNEKCFTCSAAVFADWLESVHISSLDELAEALEDDDFVSLEMKVNGLKYFKRFALKKAALNAASLHAAVSEDAKQNVASVPPTNCPPVVVAAEPPAELLCPIRHTLMTNDPVLAPDGYTYEREAIQKWLLQARQGVRALSPMTQNPLDGDAIHKLVPNLQIRTLARDWKQKHHAM